ncbi:MAG: amino acid permease [Gemmatimonadaceae bacterium]|jgi:APA family basic amino acid/polyamine antiporter|nr:amino acid permease [Gemmatimonadaceae bacterium]
MTSPASDLPNAARERGLLKILGVAFGLAVLVGNTIGMGILRTPGEVAAHLPSVPLFLGVWVAGALYALLGALSVSELSAALPESGGLFPLVKRALGPYPGFVVGWTDWLSTSGSLAAVAIVLGEYLGPLLPFTQGHSAAVASTVLLGLTLLQWRGVRMGDIAQQTTSLLKAIALIAIGIVALVASPATSATATATTVAPLAVLPSGVALAGALILSLQSAIYTYDGWTGPVYFGAEIENPGETIPRTMIGGMLLVAAIYLLLNAAFLRVVPIAEMAGDPFVAATAAKRLFGQPGETALRIVMLISMLATVNALLLMAGRIPYAMSRARLFPAALSNVNVGGTPTVAHFSTALLALLFILTNSFDRVLALLAFLFVSNYALVFLSVFVLRRREPNLPRPFRVPLYPWVPGIALVGSCAFMIAAVSSDRTNSLWAMALVAASWPLYRVLRKATTARS